MDPSRSRRYDLSKTGSTFDHIQQCSAWIYSAKNVHIRHPEIRIEKEHAPSPTGEGDGKVDGDRRLAGTAFAAGHGNELRGMMSPGKFVSKRRERFSLDEDRIVNFPDQAGIGASGHGFRELALDKLK